MTLSTQLEAAERVIEAARDIRKGIIKDGAAWGWADNAGEIGRLLEALNAYDEACGKESDAE